MYIQVRLLNGFSSQLLYEVPEEWDKDNLLGTIIKVPMRAKIELAIIEEVIPFLRNKPKFEIRMAHSMEKFPEDHTYSKLIENLSKYYQIDYMGFIKRVGQFIAEKPIKKIKVAKEDASTGESQEDSEEYFDTNYQIFAETQNARQAVELTDEQQKVFDFMAPKITNPEYCPTLLHGVTGSGKTEVYKKLIIHAIEQNKTVILLLPEVTLAMQFEQILTAGLPEEIKIFGFHSAVNPKKKQILWNMLLEKKSILIIGVHMPVLLPISNPGLIIIDEEHEVGYQEKKHPKINTKEAALLKASLYKIPILLGSATPALTSLHSIKTRNWNFFQLKNRFAGAFPEIEVVNLKDKKQRKNFWISDRLEREIKNRIAKKEQTIIFLNRRGFSFFVQCKTCSFICRCTNCSVSLTLHKNNLLYCHYCGLTAQYPEICPECKNKEFLKKGIGTEQVVSIIEKMFPYASVARADLDTTSKKTLWQQTVADFKAGRLDVLVGTQTITKGYHFPNVTLVGILWADLNLHFPIFNAAETTLQQLIQVAGRAGRQSNHSSVIIQTMINHPIFDYLNEIDYLKFYDSEMAAREKTGYPPFMRLVEIELKYTDEMVLEKESDNFAQELFDKNINDLQILGPAKPPVEKIKNIHMRKIYIKGDSINRIIELYSKINKQNYKSRIYFTPNPIN